MPKIDREGYALGLLSETGGCADAARAAIKHAKEEWGCDTPEMAAEAFKDYLAGILFVAARNGDTETIIAILERLRPEEWGLRCRDCNQPLD